MEAVTCLRKSDHYVYWNLCPQLYLIEPLVSFSWPWFPLSVALPLDESKWFWLRIGDDWFLQTTPGNQLPQCMCCFVAQFEGISTLHLASDCLLALLTVPQGWPRHSSLNSAGWVVLLRITLDCLTLTPTRGTLNLSASWQNLTTWQPQIHPVMMVPFNILGLEYSKWVSPALDQLRWVM